ncbi:MAG: tRNA (adenosine(37)-N6)-threonylcarbamoyltransferase complex dimerization subunit type 1 TsaB [Flavobacteriales bacterium]|nr:tRNA (adenosine(37)-N6)-threonylcarbamoyltransferase complex dimerization subunit type 1 TsaB [Flavobacteriales bacterium]MCB9364504.1 tRNA (adenosine(37)-N6)-threonylcarbamoyltransferase complex dimerization subunit type 1 TsaB [Flavobacteriales bacterium]
MSLILGIETATKMCSVALSDENGLLALKEVGGEYSHAENLNLFIEEVCKEAGKKLSEIDAIAVSKGPGSYTGLRIGVSAAKGFCFSLNIPLISVDTLQAMAKNPSLILHKGEKTPGYYTTDGQMWNLLHEKAKNHRKKPTEAEMVLWKFLRAKQLGFKFRRQHPVDRFIPDFVCIEKKLIIEVDGKIHDYQQEEDRIRTEILNEQGFKVIRYTNDEVLGNVNSVVQKIKIELNLLPLGACSEFISEEIERSVLFCPMIDARRMEVYTALYDTEGNKIEDISAKIIDENSFEKELKANKIIFFGDGAEKCRVVLESNPDAIFIDNIHPSAKYVNELAIEKFKNKEFEDVAYFEPFYLKDFIATTPKKLL